MRYQHRVHGVVMNVRDDKPMGAVWEPLDDSPAPARKPRASVKKAAAKTAAK